MKNNFKILFAGGGTGGHLYSGIAIAEEVRKKYPSAEVLFVGTPYGLEKEIVPACGFALDFISATPLKGSGLGARLKSLVRLPKAYRQSKAILKRFKPDFVVGIGGYASGPMTLAAHFSKIPTAVIEQNSIPGFTNRKLARFVDKIFISFEKAKDYFPARKSFLYGNPSRPLKPAAAPESKTGFTVFVLGGSQGAHTLNVALMEALPRLGAFKHKLRFIHQTGTQDFEAVRDAYAQAGYSALVFPFSNELAPHYAQADLMVCRSGAGTIAELQNLGKASILVPYPFAADDHQLYNAQEMVDAGAAELILNRDFNGEKIAARISDFLAHPETLAAMSEKARALGKPDATEKVLLECLAFLPP